MYYEVLKQYQDAPQYRGVISSCGFPLEICITLKQEDISSEFRNDFSNLLQFIMHSEKNAREKHQSQNLLEYLYVMVSSSKSATETCDHSM